MPTTIGLLSTEQPHSALVLALAPVLAASGVEVIAAIDDFLAFDIDRRAKSGLMLIPGSGPAVAERIPAERVFWIGEPPFTPKLPVGRTLGRARFHEVVGLLNGRANGGALHLAVQETGTFILSGLRVFDQTSAAYAIDGALKSGTAAERFADIFGAKVMSDPGLHAPLPQTRRDVIAPRRGTVASWSTGPLRAALQALGNGGAIGRLVPTGTATGPRKPVARLYGTDAEQVDAAQSLLVDALVLE
ncbi:MAG: hypothetical protein P1U65_12230 [Minwuia sp.]|nr:hypothetical protein [Minwuia sp.]